MQSLCADLAAEHAALDELVADLDESGWDTPTPAEPWTVRDQIGHLTFFDGRAIMAATDPDQFNADREIAINDPGAYNKLVDEVTAGSSGAELLSTWRAGRRQLIDVFSVLDPKQRIPWYGPPMSAMSKITARLMETWAHGQDVADALGRQRQPTDRLRHVAHIGVGARPFSYMVRGLDAPAEPVRVELTSPSGEQWTWGEADADNIVRGTALDFCLVITQRRHRDDTNLVAIGPLADEWLNIGQAFAGPPGAGREPGQFPHS